MCFGISGGNTHRDIGFGSQTGTRRQPAAWFNAWCPQIPCHVGPGLHDTLHESQHGFAAALRILCLVQNKGVEDAYLQHVHHEFVGPLVGFPGAWIICQVLVEFVHSIHVSVVLHHADRLWFLHSGSLDPRPYRNSSHFVLVERGDQSHHICVPPRQCHHPVVVECNPFPTAQVRIGSIVYGLWFSSVLSQCTTHMALLVQKLLTQFDTKNCPCTTCSPDLRGHQGD